jgi:HAD superfamily hydrolase (TIGR01458 family)
MSGIRAVLLDLDGTLYEDRRPLPGALDAVRRLRQAGCAVRFVTNTTERPHRAVMDDLRGMGFTDEPGDLYTAPVVAARWLARQGLERVALLVPPATHEDFASFTIDDQQPDAVVAGDLGESWDVATLNRAFRWLLGGARLVALQKNRYWQREGELVLDAGPFIAALEFAAEVEAVVVGKPSAAFFGVAVDGVGVAAARVAMVGDDVRNDVGGAQRAGLRGVLVRTGKYRPGDERGSVAPDYVVDSVAQLPDVLL